MNSQVITDANAVVQPQQAQHHMVQLVARAQAGDADAFGEIYREYHAAVLRFCYYRVGSWAVAEDISSDVFVRAMKAIGTFQWQGRDFGAWLTTIARNLVNDHHRRSRTRTEVPVDEMADANGVSLFTRAGCITSSDETLEAVLSSELSVGMQRAVRALKPEQRECIELRFFSGLDCRETARKMGRSEGAIKTLQYRAVRSLARILRAYVPA